MEKCIPKAVDVTEGCATADERGTCVNPNQGGPICSTAVSSTNRQVSDVDATCVRSASSWGVFHILRHLRLSYFKGLCLSRIITVWGEGGRGRRRTLSLVILNHVPLLTPMVCK